MDNTLDMKYRNDALVVQANELIRSTQDDLSLLEAKLIRLAISQIVATDTDIRTYTCDVSQLARYLGMTNNIYREVGLLGKSIIKKSIYLIDKSKPPKRTGEWNYKIFNWVDYFEYNSGKITIRLNDQLKPYLIGLDALFTKYGYDSILKLPTSNSIRLYELLLSYESVVNIYSPSFIPSTIFPEVERSKNELIFSIGYLKKYFDCIGKYDRDRDFIKRVIDSSVKAINSSSPTYRVSYRTAKQGRKIGYVLFKINEWADNDFIDFLSKGIEERKE